MQTRHAIVLAAALALLPALPAQAGSSRATLEVRVRVVHPCSVSAGRRGQLRHECGPRGHARRFERVERRQVSARKTLVTVTY